MIARHGSAGYRSQSIEQVPKGDGTSEVNRLTNIQHTSRIDGIAASLKALGKRLDMRTM